MSPISITFSTLTNPQFQWFDSFKDLTDEELDGIAVHCRSATAAIFTELSDRRYPWKDWTLENYYEMLLENANQINGEGLTSEHKHYLDNLYTYLAGPGDARHEVKAVRQFLWLVSTVIDWSYALLLLCTLGKHRLQKLDEDRRVKLVKYIILYRDPLFCPKLRDEATRCNLHQIHIKIDPPLTRGRKNRKINGKEETATSAKARVLESPEKNTKHHSDSEHCFPKSPTSSISYVLNEDANSDTDTTSLLQSPYGKRKREQSDSTGPSIAWTDAASAPYSKDSSWKFPGKYRQAEQEVKVGANQRNFLTPVSDTENNDDTNGNSTLPSNIIDYGALVEPQNQVATCTQSSPIFHDQIEPGISLQHPEAIANNPRSHSAVRFDQQLAQPVVNPMVAPSPVVSGLKERSIEANSNSAIRMFNWTLLKPQPALRLAQDGLIKIQSSLVTGSPGSLQDFYVHSICAGRTLLKDNAYLQEVLPIADCDAATKCAMIALTSSYYKEYLPDYSIQKEQMRKHEVEAIAQTIMALKQNTGNGHVYRDTAKMLLIHHAILNQNSHSAHWTDYLYQLQDSRGRQSNLIIAAHSILLMTILPLAEKHQFQTFNYDWIGRGEQDSLTKVNGIIGMSRKMLYFQYLITTAAKFPKVVENGNLLRDIEASCQWLDVTETEMAMRIALRTAEMYKLATKLYALARLCRFTPSHPDVTAICNRLTRELYELPASGAEYSGLHPAWCFPIACACTEDPGEYAKMDRILEYIGSANKSNVSDILRLVRWIWTWKMGRQLSGEWWEDMTEYLDSVMKGNLVCVT